MNWVGGSRTRYMMRSDTKKQKEFFEKKKMKCRLQNLGIPVPTSPQCSGSGSMDLVTLFIVNQIAAKKEIKDPPKVTVLRESKGLSKTMQNGPLELPMSPGSPSQLSLSESEPYYSVQRVKRRRHCMPNGLKCQQLSPVLESTFSDHSSLEVVQHHRPYPLSPFSSPPSACSGQGPVVFPGQPLDLQPRELSHPCSTPVPPWTASELQPVQIHNGAPCVEFRPFSQPGTMRDSTPWSSGSNTPVYLPLRPPAAVRTLFRSPLSDQSEARQPPFGFTLNQSETAEHFEEELFSGFGGEASHLARSQSKLHLNKDIPAILSRLQSPRAPQRVDCEDTPITQVSNCTNTGSPCMESSPKYLATDCCYSSESESEAADCQLCLCSKSSNNSEDLSSEPLNKSTQWTPQVPCLSRPHTPHAQPPGKCTDEQPAKAKTVTDDNCNGSALQTEGDKGHRAQNPAQVDLLKRPETSDAETQTCDITNRRTSDASTQSEACVPFNWYSDAMPHQGTRGQISSRDTEAPSALLLKGMQKGEVNGPPSNSSREEGRGHYPSGNAIKYHTLNVEGAVDREEAAHPGLDDAQVKRRMRREAGGEEGRPDCAVTAPPPKEVAVGGANRLSEEVETLQEIADILLMLRQRKREA